MRISPTILLLALCAVHRVWCLKPTRRAFLATPGAALLVPTVSEAAALSDSLLDRFQQDILIQPPTSVASELNGIDNTYYPDFMEGTWQVTQTLVNLQTPLGLQYLGGPNGDLQIAQKSFRESQNQLNLPVSLQFRFVRTPWGIAEDRLYNTQQRLDAFAGRKVVSSVQYADVGGSNRASILALGGSADTPLQTTLVYFKGPAAQKTFLTSHQGQTVLNNRFVVSEGQRSIFALTNESTAPPIWTDTQVLWDYERVDDRHVRGKLRIAGYLNAQTDQLYFQARNRAVSLQDYTLALEKVDQ